MAITDLAKEYYNKMFEGAASPLEATDPDFDELFRNFAFDEVVNANDLDDKTRYIAILATLLGCQGIAMYEHMIPAALNFGVSPVEIKEVLYQAVAYLGIGRVYPFFKITNDEFVKRYIQLPLEGQSTTNSETRQPAGTQIQVECYGDRMKEFYKSGPEESRCINYWLAANCFGDYYTRKGLGSDKKLRELITFCFLAAQGGCENQLKSHSSVNMRIGNDRLLLIKVIAQCIPYIGYPRSLNALNCVNEAAEAFNK